MAAKDMTGKVFGKLTVLYQDDSKNTAAAYWICQCECGKQKSIRGDRLRNGEVTNCGCEKKKRTIDTTSLIGQKFGRLTVLERDMSKPIGHGYESYWICECECGNKVSVIKKSLTSGHTQSCGCLRKEQLKAKNTLDLTNLRFGKLIALENTWELSAHHSYLWKCKCDCGNICYIPAEVLQQGKTNSCGCGLASKGELIISELLSKNNIAFIQEYTFEDLINPITNRKLRYDFAIFRDNNLIALIEYDGIQHFQDVKIFRDSLHEIQYRDQLKTQYAADHQIPLIRIPYWKLNNLTIEDLKNEVA